MSKKHGSLPMGTILDGSTMFLAHCLGGFWSGVAGFRLTSLLVSAPPVSLPYMLESGPLIGELSNSAIHPGARYVSCRTTLPPVPREVSLGMWGVESFPVTVRILYYIATLGSWPGRCDGVRYLPWYLPVGRQGLHMTRL